MRALVSADHEARRVQSLQEGSRLQFLSSIKSEYTFEIYLLYGSGTLGINNFKCNLTTHHPVQMVKILN